MPGQGPRGGAGQGKDRENTILDFSVCRQAFGARVVPAAVFAAAVLAGCGERPEAGRIFLGGNIVTANAQRPEVEALAVRHGRIMAVGNRGEVLAFRGPDTEVTRLGERALLPGFIAPHGSLPVSMDGGADAGARTAVRRALAGYAQRGFTTVTVFRPGEVTRHLRAVARSDSAPVRVQAYMGVSKRGRIPRLIADNEARFRVLGLAPGPGVGSGLEQAVLEAHRSGYQVALRAGTSERLARGLEVLARAREVQERADARHRLEGCTRASRDQLHRAGVLGATCSFRAPERAAAGTAERLGRRFSLQGEGRPDALALLERAVIGPEPGERVPIDRAIAALTRDAAWQTHADNDRGRLEVGQYADLVLLDANPRKTKPEKLSEIEVLATWVAGRRIAQSEKQSGDDS